MFGFQPTDLIGILIVALLLFGPSRLPQIGRALGSTMREFQNAAREATSGFQEEAKPSSANREEETRVSCKNCRQPIEMGMKFCPECGAAQ